ncbi:MAG: hypothetical protein A4S09_05140 [Proteobacteria bacterium SG_bin7]|nr:MAG: hypothetical protein A4S09_05140 [Proteobacteria bacterium SG_bin7]
MLFKIWIILSAMFLLSGCTERAAPINPNEKEKEQVLQPLKDEKDPKLKSIEDYDLRSADKALRTPDADIYKMVIQPLEKFVLDPEVVHNKNYATRPKTQEMLRCFNSGLLELSKNKNSELTRVLDKYEELLLEGCKINLQKCVNLSYFSMDPRSSKVAQILAQRQNQLDEFYQRLTVAFSIRNRNPDPELNGLYLSKSKEYRNLLQKDPNTSKDRILLHEKILALILKSATDTDAQRLAPLLSTFSPWAVSRVNSQSVGGSSEDFLKLTAKTSLYEGGNLNAGLVKFISEAQKEPRSFTAHQNELFNRHHKLFVNLELKKVSDYNEYFYLVDRVYGDHISASDAFVIWQSTQKKKDVMAKVIEGYIQTELAYMIKSSHEQLSLYFQDPEKVNSQTLYDDVIKFGEVLRNPWREFLKNTENVNVFANQIFDFSKDTSSDLYKAFVSIRRTIKYAVVYPQMMMLVYHMGKRDFGKNFDYYSNNTRGSTVPVGKFFNGEGEAWFEYGTDRAPLSRYEILDAFQFALTTDIFSIFKIDVTDFLRVVADQLLTPKLNLVKNQIERIIRKYETGTEWAKLYDVCQSIRSGRQFTFTYPIEHMIDSPSLGSSMAALKSYNEGSEGWNKAIESSSRLVVSGAYNLYDLGFVDLLEYIRIHINPTLQYLETMKKLYELSLKKSGVSEEIVAGKIKIVDDQLVPMSQLKQAFIDKFSLRHTQYSKCYLTLTHYDLDMQSKIIESEIQYLKRVHKDMAAVRSNSTIAPTLNRKYSFHNLPEDFKGYNSFDKESLRYFPIDFMLRVREFFKKAYPNLEVVVPENIKEWLPYIDPHGFTVYYNDDENIFVADGLRAMLATGVKNWFESGYINGGTWRNWLNAIAILYRMGEISDPSELVNTPLEMFKLISIGDADASFFKMVGLASRFNDVKVGAILGIKAGEPKGYLDSIYGWLYSDYLSSYGDPRMYSCGEQGMPCEPPKELLPLLKRAKEYFLWHYSDAKFVYPFVRSAKSSIGLALKEAIKKEDEQMKAFELAVQSRYELDKNRKSLLVFQMILGKTYRPPYLSETAKGMYFSERATFHNRQTGNIFSSGN